MTDHRGERMKSMICRLLAALMIWTQFQLAHAGAIGTDSAIASSAPLDAQFEPQFDPRFDRQALVSFVGRAEVASQLAALGVDPAAARERIAALSDDEA